MNLLLLFNRSDIIKKVREMSGVDYSKKRAYIDLIQVCEDFLSPMSRYNPEKSDEKLLAKVIHVYNSVSTSCSIGDFGKNKLKTDILRLNDLLVSILHMNSVRKTNRKILTLIRSQGEEESSVEEVADRHVLTSDNRYKMENAALAVGIGIELSAHKLNLSHYNLMKERYSCNEDGE